MRLYRFDLTRYGKFTDYSVDFGERVPGVPDLHVIYGPNEAGKSTLFSAWLDLLYGMGIQSPFNFLHPYPAMRIGGVLELSGGRREFVRIKRSQNSLLDAHGQPIGENSILGDLGGIDREAYRAMFSLNDDTLEEGGESILKARGDLGQLLFSGSSGLAGLSRKIEDLHSEADGFYKSHARSGQLQDLQKKLIQLKQERERIDTQAWKHAELAETAKRAKARHDDTAARRGQTQARKDEIQHLLSALPRLTKLRALRERLDPLRELPDAPAGWAKTLPDLRDEEIRLETQIGTNAEEIERLTSAVEAIDVDDAALGLAGRLDDAVSMRARYLTAEKDLPERRQKLRDLNHTIAFHLRQVEREGDASPERFILPASTTERLRELIEGHSGIEIGVNKAAEELSEAKHRLEAAADKLAGSVNAASAADDRKYPLENLRAGFAAFRASDHTARRRLAERACLEGQAVLDDCLAALAPWHGDMDQLVAMVVPELETRQHWKMAQDDAQKRIGQQSGEVERLKNECARLSTQLDAVTSVTGLVTDQEAAAIRGQRDHAWAEHRNRLNAASADQFEELLHRDDSVVAQRFRHMAELAQLHEAARGLKVGQSDLARAEEARAQALTDVEAIKRDIAKAIGTLSASLPPDWTLPQLEGWLARREKALEARSTIGKAERDMQQAQNDANVQVLRLAAALRALNLSLAVDADETALVAMAQTALDGETEYRRLQQDLEERQRDLKARERAFERADAEKRQWDTAWNDICGACWLGENGATPSIAIVRGVLGITSELGSALKERATLVDRIGKMEEDLGAFRNVAVSLADAAGIAHADALAVMDLVRQIEERIRKAEADRSQKAKETERLKAARAASRKLAEQKLAHNRRKQELTSYFGGSTLAEVATKLDQIALRENVRREVAEVVQDIQGILRVSSLPEAEAILASADQAALERELAEITTLAEELEQEWRNSFATYKNTEKQIETIGGDAKVAELEEQRRTILLEIDESARRHMRLRAGAMATQWALRLYREQHRSSMMTRASEALRIISRSAYTHLTTQPDKDGEVLVAIAAGKSSKLVTEMSKGTRFQLYLALRVAGYFEFAKTGSPVPFIADDIMETFDDFRAGEAIRLFSQMAEIGQVIYLTHHRHLCELAREACPNVKIHDLPERMLDEHSVKTKNDAVESSEKPKEKHIEMEVM